MIFAYAEKGHTHGPLDGVFGQCVVKLALSEFNTADGVVKILQGFLDTAGLDPEAKANAAAYKLDEAAQWAEWFSDVPVHFRSVTGPLAPHWFHITQRKNLSMEELDVLGPPDGHAHMDDVVMAVKEKMSSYRPYQVVKLMSGASLDLWQHQTQQQPRGIAPRRQFLHRDRIKVQQQAQAALEAGAISAEAEEYLRLWSMSTLRRYARPRRYEFLGYRCAQHNNPGGLDRAAAAAVTHGQEQPQAGSRPPAPRPIQVIREDMAAEPASDGEAEEDRDGLEVLQDENDARKHGG